MKRIASLLLITLLSVFLFVVPVIAGAETPPVALRLSTFDTASLPKAVAVLDVKPGPRGFPALAADDFRFLEDGKGGPSGSATRSFRDSGMGLALVLAIDVSPSMEGSPLHAIRRGLVHLVSRKRTADRVAILSFADDMRWETRWDVSPDKMQETLKNLQTRGRATRLYDAVGQSLDELGTQSRQDAAFPTRMCVLVLSDGHDEGSRTTLSAITTRLRNSRTRVDAIGVSHSPVWLRSLQAIADAGFGGFRSASMPDQIEDLLGEGIDKVLDMPVIEFEAGRSLGDGKTHTLGVEYLPTHYRDQLSMVTAKLPIYGDARFWVVLAGAAALIVSLSFFLARGHSVPVAVSSNALPSQSAVVPPDPAPPKSRSNSRPETVVETTRENLPRRSHPGCVRPRRWSGRETPFGRPPCA